MKTLDQALSSAHNEAPHAGVVIAGLRALRERCSEVLVIASRKADPLRIASSAISCDLDGLLLEGAPWVRFESIRAWERDSGDACVCWEHEGIRTVVAPARAIDLHQIARDLCRFVENGFEDDFVHLSDLDGPVGSRLQQDLSIRDGILRVNSENIPLENVAWTRHEHDGDGNLHCHIVLDDGRYRIVSVGDLSR